MGWIHKGGGYYENEETGERVRGKANLPADSGFAEPAVAEVFTYQCVGNCYEETEHDVEKYDGYDLLTCVECGASVARNP